MQIIKKHLLFIVLNILFISISCQRGNNAEDIQIKFYNGNFYNKSVKLPLPKFPNLMNLNGFKNSSMTVIYLHGYDEVTNPRSTKVIVEAYLRYRPNMNVIVADWTNMVEGSSSNSVDTLKIGRAIGKHLLEAIASGLRAKTLHIVAYSLNCYVASAIGQLTRTAGAIVARITGLDCLFRIMFPSVTSWRLRSDAAAFVDIIHTDYSRQGFSESVAHADFWPNGGSRSQPGCEETSIISFITNSNLDLCSHRRSWIYYAESIRSPKAFLAKQCSNYRTYLNSMCQDNSRAYMGLGTTVSSRGDFFLTTDDKSPFGRGTQRS